MEQTQTYGRNKFTQLFRRDLKIIKNKRELWPVSYCPWWEIYYNMMINLLFYQRKYIFYDMFILESMKDDIPLYEAL